MAVGLAELTAADAAVTLGGVEFRARALRLSEWGGLQRWYEEHVPHPLAELARAIDQARQQGRPMGEDAVRLLYGQAASRPFPPRVGTFAWIEGLDSAEGGIAQFLLAALAPCNEGFGPEEAESLAESATTEELIALQAIAIMGRLPAPKSPGSTTTTGDATSPTDAPATTTPGAASSTPSATAGA